MSKCFLKICTRSSTSQSQRQTIDENFVRKENNSVYILALKDNIIGLAYCINRG